MTFDPYKQKAPAKKHSAPPVESKAPKSVEQVIARSAIKGIPERGISPEACQMVGVRTECDPESGKPIAHYFPYCGPDRKLRCFKRVDLLIPKKGEFRYTVIPKGALTPDCLLFNQTRCKGGKRITLIEGEYDVLACVEGYLQAGDKKYDCPDVVSIGFGTKNAGLHLSHHTEFINSYQMKVGCFDNDTATPEEAKRGIEKGREAMDQALLLFPDLYDLTFKSKDANDELQAGNVTDFWNQFLWSPKLFEPSSIITESLPEEVLFEPLQQGVYIDGLPKTMEMLHGFRPSELTLVIAPSGIGKTTLTKHIGFHINKAGNPTANIFLEEDLKKAQQSYISMACQVPLNRFRENPGIVPIDMRRQAISDYIDNGRTAWLRHHYGLSPKTLIQQLAIFDAKGYRFAVLDHITQVTNKGKGRNKVEQIDELMEQLYEFIESSQMHLIVVSHISRLNFTPPREKNGEIKYPYWEEFPMDKARGSGAFEQYSWNIIGLEAERLANRQRGRVRTMIHKNREWGVLGIGDIFYQDENTGLIRPCDPVGG